MRNMGSNLCSVSLSHRAGSATSSQSIPHTCFQGVLDAARLSDVPKGQSGTTQSNEMPPKKRGEAHACSMLLSRDDVASCMQGGWFSQLR